MRICIVVDYYPPHIGGGELFASKIAEGLAQHGDECTVITLRTDASPPVDDRGNLRIIRIGNPTSPSRLKFGLLAIPAIISSARECDIIHGASYGGAFPAFVAAKILRKKSIFMVYEFMGGLWRHLEPNRFKAFFYSTAEKMIARMPFDRFVAISKYTRNCLRLFGIPDSKLERVYGGENLKIIQPAQARTVVRSVLGLTSDDFVYVAYGRAGITKGIEVFVEAIPLILKKVPSAKFVLIITKDDIRIWKRIEGGLKRIPPEAYRLMPGMTDNELANHLSASDCVVVPSLSEGFGFAVLEACALGKKVVASDAGSIPEVVFGEYVLVKPGSADELAEGCQRAFMGDMDYGRPKNFRWEITVKDFRRIYKEVLSQHPHE